MKADFQCHTTEVNDFCEGICLTNKGGRNGQKVQSTDCSRCTSLAGETLDKKSLLHNETLETLDKKSLLHNEGYASELTQDKNIEIGMRQL